MSVSEALSLANATLGSAADLALWLRASAGSGSDHVDGLALRLPDFLELRSCVRELLEGAIAGGSLPAEAVERLNETSARVPRIALLQGGSVSLTPIAGAGAPLVLARISWSAMELVGGPERDRLRRCGACGRYFVATRPDRVWCSDRCGNRIRVARHHARIRGPTYPVPG